VIVSVFCPTIDDETVFPGAGDAEADEANVVLTATTAVATTATATNFLLM